MKEENNKFPSSFQLGAVTWRILFDNVKLDAESCIGLSEGITCEITLQDKHKGQIMTNEGIEQTLYHEVIHAILESMGEYELAKNEKFVQSFSMFLHQFEKSKK